MKLKKLAYCSCVFVLGGMMAHADSVSCTINGVNASCATSPFVSQTLPVIAYDVSGNTISINSYAAIELFQPSGDTNSYSENLQFSDELFFHASAAGDYLITTAGYEADGAAYISLNFNNSTGKYLFGFNSAVGSVPAETYTDPANGFASLIASGHVSPSTYINADPAGEGGLTFTIQRFHADGSPDDFTNVSNTPEPATWGLLALSGLGLISYRNIRNAGRNKT